MKAAAISGAVIAALAAGALATPTFAQPYRSYAYDNGCQTRSDGTAGAVIGGIAGALLGSNLASHHGGRAGGAAIGGVAGALIGNSIARSNDGCRTYSQAYRAPVYGYRDRYASGYGDSYAYRDNSRYQAYGDNDRYQAYRDTRYERPAYDRYHRDYRYGY
jgi:hypothetical protein